MNYQKTLNLEVIDFCEKYLNIKLYDYQKYFITKAYEAFKNNGSLIYITPRGYSKEQLSVLQFLAILKAEYDLENQNINSRGNRSKLLDMEE